MPEVTSLPPVCAAPLSERAERANVVTPFYALIIMAAWSIACAYFPLVLLQLFAGSKVYDYVDEDGSTYNTNDLKADGGTLSLKVWSDIMCLLVASGILFLRRFVLASLILHYFTTSCLCRASF